MKRERKKILPGYLISSITSEKFCIMLWTLNKLWYICSCTCTLTNVIVHFYVNLTHTVHSAECLCWWSCLLASVRSRWTPGCTGSRLTRRCCHWGWWREGGRWCPWSAGTWPGTAPQPHSCWWQGSQRSSKITNHHHHNHHHNHNHHHHHHHQNYIKL